MWDLTNVKEQSFDALPKGEYQVVAKAGELKDTKTGSGKYVKVEFTVCDGPYQGRKLFHNFNVKNSNQKAVDIGLQQMKTFFKCAGSKNEHLNNLTPDSFAGQGCYALVDIETDSYGVRNIIKGFKTIPDTPTIAPKPKVTAAF